MFLLGDLEVPGFFHHKVGHVGYLQHRSRQVQPITFMNTYIKT